jgi:hypothetical protein
MSSRAAVYGLRALAIGSVSWDAHRVRHVVLLARLEHLLGLLQIDSKADRSVLGSLRVPADELRYGSLPRVAHVLDLDPLVVSHKVHHRPCMVGKRRRVYRLEDLLKCITPRNVYEEVDFSEPVGR